MRWGKTKRTQEENSTEKKKLSLSDLLSFSWLSKFRSNNKTQNKTSPKPPSCKPKFVSKNSIVQNVKLNSRPCSPCHLSTDQTIAPRRRSVGDEDRPITNQHRRYYSVGGDHVCSTMSSMTLGHVIPFSIVPKQNRIIPLPVSPLYQEVPDPGLYPHKVRRRRKLKSRLVIAASDDTRRKSFNGKTRSRRYRRVSTRSLIRQEKKGLENFAVVKRSREPERDFKNSMLEMILEKGISQPEELESLLTCYLTLNADEHYDVIVKVFRQVCFEINHKQIGGTLKNSL